MKFLIFLITFLTILHLDAQIIFDAKNFGQSKAAVSGKNALVTENGIGVINPEGKPFNGIQIKGSWNIENSDIIEFCVTNNDDSDGILLTIRVNNEGANPSKREKFFMSKIFVPAKSNVIASINIPKALPNPELAKKLFGMQGSPLGQGLDVEALEGYEIVSLDIYSREQSYKQNWCVKKIEAKKSDVKKNMPDYFYFTEQEFFPFIDMFGQFKHRDWKNKIHSESDFIKAKNLEAADLQNHPSAPNLDEFGGFISEKKFEAKGHFYTKKIDGKWWLIDPLGNLFWSHGVLRVSASCGVTVLDDRRFYFENLPEASQDFAAFYENGDKLLQPYYEVRNIKEVFDFSRANLYRKYGKNWEQDFADLAHKRLKSWGLNTIANGSDKFIYSQSKTPYIERFEIKSKPIEASGGHWWKFKDPFDPSFRDDLRKNLVERKSLIEDKFCIGFFVDNEINWGNPDTLANWVLLSSEKQSAKHVFLRNMQDKYSTIDKLNSAWGVNFKDWKDFLTQKFTPKTAEARKDLIAFSDIITEEYFKIIKEEFANLAPQKLYLGCRFAGFNTSTVAIAAKYCDVLSFNIYQDSLKSFNLPKGVDMPVMIGEFHFGALDRGLFHASLVAKENQAERAKAYYGYVLSALKHPNFVGTHWHQFSDQATSGRFDGENFQVGFTDICDTPYYETIEKIREVGYALYDLRIK